MEKGHSPVQSIDRLFDIVEALSNAPRGMALSDLSAAVGLHTSTTHRLLAALVARGYVQKDIESGKYRLTMRLFEVGSRAVGGMNIVSLARPYLEHLAATTHEAIHLVVRDGDEVVYLYKENMGDSTVRMASFVGLRNPMYCTAVGKSILSCLPEAEVAAIWQRTVITRFTPHTIVDYADLIAELVKAGKIKEISDMRDETDLNGLKLTLDLKRGVDADKLMAKLFKATPLEDSFSCNFNILVSGQPRVMGVREILQEWTAFRMECVRRRTWYDLHGKEKRLHLLKGLAAILMDIDKAIHIIRTTEEETEVVPNLMIGFGIDEVQADYVAEIKLRHLNREYILKRTGEIEQLEADIADLNDILAKPARIRKIIMKELADVAKKYGQPRRSEILYDLPEEEGGAEEEAVPDYPVTVFFTREGYLKKIPPQSLRTAGAHKLKEGDEIVQQVETRNNVEALFFTDKQQVYKVRLAELEDGKVAQMGIYLPGRLGMDEGESILDMVITSDYGGYMLFFFAGGKCAKIPLSSYATKQNRRKLLKAYCDKEPLATMFFLPEETELAIRTSAGRMLLVGTAQIAEAIGYRSLDRESWGR